jgi:hypothetical protein
MKPKAAKANVNLQEVLNYLKSEGLLTEKRSEHLTTLMRIKAPVMNVASSKLIFVKPERKDMYTKSFVSQTLPVKPGSTAPTTNANSDPTSPDEIPCHLHPFPHLHSLWSVVHFKLSRDAQLARNLHIGEQVKDLENKLGDSIIAQLRDEAVPRGNVKDWFESETDDPRHKALLTFFQVRSMQALREKLCVEPDETIIKTMHINLKYYACVVEVWPMLLMLNLKPSEIYMYAWSIFTGYTRVANTCRSKEDFESKFSASFIEATVTMSKAKMSEPTGERACWVCWEYADEDDLILFFRASGETIRLVAIDGIESGKQGPPIVRKLLTHFRGLGYTKARLWREYGQDKYERTIGHVVLAKLGDEEHPHRWLHVHKLLLALGAAYVYPLFLAGISREEVLELWELQGNAKRRSEKIRIDLLRDHSAEYDISLKEHFKGKAASIPRNKENSSNFCLTRTQWEKLNKAIYHKNFGLSAPPTAHGGGLTDPKWLDSWFNKKWVYTVFIATELKEKDGTFGLWKHPVEWYKNFPSPWWKGVLEIDQQIGSPHLVKLLAKAILACDQWQVAKTFGGGVRDAISWMRPRRGRKRKRAKGENKRTRVN